MISFVYFNENHYRLHSQYDPAELNKRNQEIDTGIEKDRAVMKKTQKILLLGGPECGKSTIFKQMRSVARVDGKERK